MTILASGTPDMGRLGLTAGLTDDLAALPGRPPLDFRAFARDHAAAWRPAALAAP
jgi:hypothetical protein